MTKLFYYNGIKVDGKLHKCWYMMDRGRDASPITIYGKRYRDLPQIEGLTVQNDSDLMSDYFENDRIRVTLDSPHYPAVLAAYNQQEAKRKARCIAKGDC